MKPKHNHQPHSMETQRSIKRVAAKCVKFVHQNAKNDIYSVVMSLSTNELAQIWALRISHFLQTSSEVKVTWGPPCCKLIDLQLCCQCFSVTLAMNSLCKSATFQPPPSMGVIGATFLNYLATFGGALYFHERNWADLPTHRTSVDQIMSME